MRPPRYNKHFELIKEYMRDLGLIGLSQEIRFAVNEEDVDEKEQILNAINCFQDELTRIQDKRIQAGKIGFLGQKNE